MRKPPFFTGDLESSKLMWLKAVLFLLIGVVCALLLFLENPTLRAAVFIVLTIWAFCRAYYFAFYVIEHYVDPTYRFSGLFSFFRYLLRKRGRK